MDPILSIAFSMHATWGAYALLLGSGVSRSAGVPTGWEVVVDLVGRVARAEGAEAPRDLMDWYREKYQAEPDYSMLLEKLTPGAGDRQALLRPYFEPTPEEREQSLKVPTPAHHAIAELVERGFVRVIITTNFDRLLEAALNARGIAPSIIASPDQAEGALPLAHSRITIIKVHGDYLDTRLKNTPAELSDYDERINGLLDQVFDEYGLVACGWSAEWDEALRAAIERCKSQRFSMFFASRSEPRGAALQLINHRRAIVTPIDSADEFFVDLKEKLVSLEELERPHPVSKAVAVASLKRYLPEERHKIRLHDLVAREVAQIGERLVSDEFDTSQRWDPELFRERVKRMEALTETAEALLAVGCYWGRSSQHAVWRKALTRTARNQALGGTTVYINLKSYPALRMLYAGGIAAVANRRFDTLAALFMTPLLNPRTAQEERAVQVLAPFQVMDGDAGKFLPGLDRRFTPLSDHLFDTIRPAFEDLQIDDSTFQEAFDVFEYFLGLVFSHVSSTRGWGPVGRLGWKWRSWPSETSKFDRIREEAELAGADWEPLRAGLFSGQLQEFLEVEERYRKHVLELPWH